MYTNGVQRIAVYAHTDTCHTLRAVRTHAQRLYVRLLPERRPEWKGREWERESETCWQYIQSDCSATIISIQHYNNNFCAFKPCTDGSFHNTHRENDFSALIQLKCNTNWIQMQNGAFVIAGWTCKWEIDGWKSQLDWSGWGNVWMCFYWSESMSALRFHFDGKIQLHTSFSTTIRGDEIIFSLCVH